MQYLFVRFSGFYLFTLQSRHFSTELESCKAYNSTQMVRTYVSTYVGATGLTCPNKVEAAQWAVLQVIHQVRGTVGHKIPNKNHKALAMAEFTEEDARTRQPAAKSNPAQLTMEKAQWQDLQETDWVKEHNEEVIAYLDAQLSSIGKGGVLLEQQHQQHQEATMRKKAVQAW